jgi:DNA-directed RNA polymerase III subunit RPC2
MDRGFGRCLVLRKYQTSLKDHKHDVQDRAEKPLPTGTSSRASKKFDSLDDDGIADVGRILRKDTAMVYKLTAVQNNLVNNARPTYHPTPLIYKGPSEAIVDKVLVTNNDTEGKTRVVKVLIRQCRRPEIGDKFSSRHGQKGTSTYVHDT